ncbi:MAG: hypothetical protein A2487_02705 [Candidatus Raymondbacteria bacterium RifOxyC12_full_50_8]|nr:MAG: hypothetical protein A2487_02705 [Candidatus Raymondbacteria bacterium RifOxyC12_full_50_8]
MRMLLAIDSFKESMTSLQAAKAFEQGIRTVLPQISIATLLVSDGGEGFTEAFLHTGKGHRVRTMVTGPLGKRIMAHFGIFDRGKQAVVELAQASGLALLKPGERNPMRTSSYGTGELINAAIQQGVRTITVGIGGSATNDGGIGMAQALGAIFYNAQGDLIAAPATGKDLLSIARIDLSGVRRRLSGVRIAVACDVANPMTGPRGSSAVYGPQKGATPAMVRHLDAGLRNLCRVIRKDVGKNIERMPGAGAAGGIGGGFVAFLGARLLPGIDTLLDAVGFDSLLASADLGVTGEGAIDGQTVNNKAPVGVARRARKRGVPVIAVCGAIGPGAHRVHDQGIGAVYCITPGPMSLERAIGSGKKHMTQAGETIGRLLTLLPGMGKGT